MSIPPNIKSEAITIFMRAQARLEELKGRSDELLSELRAEAPEEVQAVGRLLSRYLCSMLDELGASDELKNFTRDTIQNLTTRNDQ